MESLSAVLGPYQQEILTVATFFTVLQFFSGIIICKTIYTKKSTKDISAIAFISPIVMSMLMLKYAYMVDDGLMILVNSLALILYVAYLIFYTIYSEDPVNEVLKPLGIGIVLMLSMMGYSKYEDPELVKWRYAFITTAFMIILLGLPLLDVQKILEEQVASDIDLPAAILGLVVSLLWLLYGVSIQNTFMMVQNLLCTILTGVQIGLGTVYPAVENTPS